MHIITKVFLASITLAVLFSLNALIKCNAASPSSLNTNTWLSGYWQNFDNPAQTPVRLIDIPVEYKTIDIAFADMAADGSVSFSLQGPPYSMMLNGEAVFKQDIQALQQKGIKVLLSIGGQNGYYQINTVEQENHFVSTLSQIILAYGFDGLDYDFESGLTSANVNFLVDATQKLKSDFRLKSKSLLFSLAPETIDVYWQVFPYGKYDQLIQSGLIDKIQVQLYNSGCMPGSQPGSVCNTQGTEDFIVSQADSTIQVWTKNGVKDAAKKYVIGLPATISAAGGGYTDPIVIKKALSCLQTKSDCGQYVPAQTYPDLASFMTWSINWDAKNSYAFQKTVSALGVNNR